MSLLSHGLGRRVARLTCVAFAADAGVPPFPAGADAPVQAGVGVAQVDLGLAVVPGEAHRAAAAQACDWVDGPEQDGVRGDEGGGAVEAQHGDALHVVLTRLAQTHVVVEREHLPAQERKSCERSVSIMLPFILHSSHRPLTSSLCSNRSLLHCPMTSAPAPF